MDLHTIVPKSKLRQYASPAKLSIRQGSLLPSAHLLHRLHPV